MVTYQDTIHQIDPTINPAGVEASMRLQFGTLDHLAFEEFEWEVEVARQCEAEAPGYLAAIAESYGLGDDFRRWQKEIQK